MRSFFVSAESRTRTRTRLRTKRTMAAPLHVLTHTQQILDLVFVVLLIKMGKVFRETLTVRPSPNQSESVPAQMRPRQQPCARWVVSLFACLV